MKEYFFKIFILFSLLSTFLFSENKPLIVGMELAYPPFETIDNNGNPQGISVEIAKELGNFLGRDIEIENMAWTGLLPSLLTKKIDIILSSMTITEERKKAVNFSNPYAESFITMLVNSKSTVKSPKDLNYSDKIIVAKTGTTGHIIAQKYFPNAKLRLFEKESAAVLEITQGKADAFLYDPLTVIKNHELNPSTTRVILQKFQDENEKWGIAYRKDDISLGESIDTFLKNFKERKGFDPLIEKYLKKEKEIFDKEKIPFFIGN